MVKESKTSRKFIYKTTVTWDREKRGFLNSPGKQTIEIGTPLEFNGHKGVWSPEDLFVASVNACIKTTFLYYAQKENLDFLSYESEAEGILERRENKFMFSSVTVMPKIVIASASQAPRAGELFDLAEKNCLISHSIVAKVTVTPDIRTRE